MATREYQTDLLVIGGGLAGTFAAIKARDAGVENLLLVDKATVGRSGCSTFAAGVITAWFPWDNLDEWVRETVEHGEYLNDQEWLECLYTEGYPRVLDLESWGVKLVRNEKGEIVRALGRGQLGHKALRNIMFHGPEFMETMRQQVLKRRIPTEQRVMVTDLLTRDGRVVGAVGFNPRTGDQYTFHAKTTILAAGANVFKSISIGHRNITGDAHGMAFRAGARHTCFEFGTQNVSLRNYDTAGLNMFVGTGARFVNGRGEAFMARYYPEYKDQAIIPRIAGAMAMEVHKGRGPIYIDMRHFTDAQADRLRQVLPLIMKVVEEAGFDVQRDLIEVVERGGAYSDASGGGGAVIDRRCRTDLEGLYAVGDSAVTTTYNGVGDSGAQNLLWCMVTGTIAAEDAAAELSGRELVDPEPRQVEVLSEAYLAPSNRSGGLSPDEALLKLQQTMFPYDVTILRHGERLQRALDRVEAMRDEDLPRLSAADGHELVKANELRNLVLCAELFLRSSLYRTESRGANQREDYPYTDNNDWLKWVTLTPSEGGKRIDMGTIPLPIERYKFKPEPGRFLYPVFAAPEPGE